MWAVSLEVLTQCVKCDANKGRIGGVYLSTLSWREGFTLLPECNQSNVKLKVSPTRKIISYHVFPKIWLAFLILLTPNQQFLFPFKKYGIPHKSSINQASESLSNLILLETVLAKTIWELQLLRQVIVLSVTLYLNVLPHSVTDFLVFYFCKWQSSLYFCLKITLEWSCEQGKHGAASGSYRSALVMFCLCIWSKAPEPSSTDHF